MDIGSQNFTSVADNEILFEYLINPIPRGLWYNFNYCWHSNVKIGEKGDCPIGANTH